MDVGAKLLFRILAEGDIQTFFKYKLTEQFFEGDELTLFQFVRSHVNNYHMLPQLETVGAAFPTLPSGVESSEYYLDKVEERFVHKTMKVALYETHQLLNEQKVYEARQKVEMLVKHLTLESIRQQVLDFGKDALQLIATSYDMAQGKGFEDAILFGWPYMDQMTSGLVAGDVVSFVGRIAAGKTYMILNQAHHVWWEQKRDTMLVSMEMGLTPIAQRLSAMHTHLPIDEIKQGNLITQPKNLKIEFFKKLAVMEQAEQKFYILDGNLSSTPDEIFALVDHFKPQVLFIDGAYLLRHEDRRLRRTERVTDNIETIKRLTSRHQIPTVNSFQFNRDAVKKKQEADLEDIGLSDAIGQVSSIVLGLFEEDSVETLRKRNVKVLKGREGAIGEFEINWDFHTMDFSEIAKPNLMAMEKPPELAYM